MRKVNEYVVFKKDVCIIDEIRGNEYILKPLFDKSLTICVSIDNPLLRDVITKEKGEKLKQAITNSKGE